MRKTVFCLLFLLIIVILASCGTSPESCVHTDDNHDGICDQCEKRLDGETVHYDGDGNSICDGCGARLQKDESIPCEHKDENDDLKCDDCKCDFDDGTESTQGLIFEINDDRRGYTLTDGTKVNGNEVVISTYNGLPITAIDDGAFKQSEIRSITFDTPELKSIGKDAFYLCNGLAEITIPDSVTQIGENAFGKCPKSVFHQPVFTGMKGDHR